VGRVSVSLSGDGASGVAVSGAGVWGEMCVFVGVSRDVVSVAVSISGVSEVGEASGIGTATDVSTGGVNTGVGIGTG
jgi:hypothetical protein